MWLRLCLCDSDTIMNISLYAILNTASRTKKGVLTAVEAETCARPNLGTLMVAGAILAALLQVVQITRKWRELRAVSSYVFLEGWRSAFGAQSNAKRTTSSLNDIGRDIVIAPDSAQRQISKPLESVVRKWSNRQTKRRARRPGARAAPAIASRQFPPEVGETQSLISLQATDQEASSVRVRLGYAMLGVCPVDCGPTCASVSPSRWGRRWSDPRCVRGASFVPATSPEIVELISKRTATTLDC